VRPFTPPGHRASDRPSQPEGKPNVAAPTSDAQRANEAQRERARIAAIVQSVAEQVRSGQIQVSSGSATGDAPAVLAAVLAAMLSGRR
jgi:hypothetical protein